MPTLIGPESLEPDAVVPQCLDNQYVSDSVFAKMVAGSLNYEHAEIARLRENDFRTEFIRSLVYSSQVVIQRAFLKNSAFLYKNFLPEDTENFQAFAQLIRDKAIVPFLFKESSLKDELSFDFSKEGDRATKALLDELADITCVRLSVDEQTNKKASDSMATAFGTGLLRLACMNMDQRNAMASELFLDRWRLEKPGVWEAFNQAVDDLVNYTFKKISKLRTSDELIRREHVYRDNFMQDPQENVSHGRFKMPSRDNPFLFELKKYVDLIYNVNLPDHLGRYTFTPENLPSRMAMQEAPKGGFTHQEVSTIVSNQDALESIRRTFLAHTQKAMKLPLLSELTVADVREIRTLPEWKTFADSQTGILRHPKELLSRLERFQSDFDTFQGALSRWYNVKYKKTQTQKAYCSFISLVLSIGGKLIVAGSHLGPIGKGAVGFAADLAVKHIPEKIETYAAKLMVGVYDLGEKKLDADRSYTVELMQTNTELMGEDVIDLLHSINANAESPLPTQLEQVADQGTL